MARSRRRRYRRRSRVSRRGLRRRTWGRRRIRSRRPGRVHRFRRTCNLLVDASTLPQSTLVIAGTNFSISSDGGICRLIQGNVSTQPTYYVSYCLNFRLASLPSYTEFTSLFDQYRIDWIKFRIRPFGAPATAPNSMGIRHAWVHDWDTSTPPPNTQAGFDALRQYESFKDHLIGPAGTTIFYRPRIAVPAYRTAVTTAYMVSRSKFIDATYSDVDHYGLRGMFLLDGGNTNDYRDFEITAEVGISCANVR